MTFNAMTEHYEEITVCGKPALFTSIRIKRDTVPDGLYAYDVRHDDECRGIPCEIAPFVMVNHWGTIILSEKRTAYRCPRNNSELYQILLRGVPVLSGEAGRFAGQTDPCLQ